MLFETGKIYWCMLSERHVFLKEILDEVGLEAVVVAYNFSLGSFEEYETSTVMLMHPEGFEKRMFN